jgi:hypothetical protein
MVFSKKPEKPVPITLDHLFSWHLPANRL